VSWLDGCASNPRGGSEKDVEEISKDPRVGARSGGEAPHPLDLRAEAGTADMGKEYEKAKKRLILGRPGRVAEKIAN